MHLPDQEWVGGEAVWGIPQAYHHHGNGQSFVPNLRHFKQQVVSQGKRSVHLPDSLPSTLPTVSAAEATDSPAAAGV